MKRSDFPLSDLQHKMLDYYHENPRAKMFATQGARKTQTTLCHVETHPEFKRVLIVCLKDNIKTWADEIHKWLPEPESRYTLLRGTAAKKRKLVDEYLESDKKYLIMSYDTAKPSSLYKDGAVVPGKKNRKMTAFFKKRAKEFDIVIMDESCEISNHKSARFKALYKVVRDIDHRIILDGDPTADGIEKIFAQFWMCDDGEVFGTTFWGFRDMFFTDVGYKYPDWELRPGSIEKMGKILKETAFIVTEDELKESIGLPEVDHTVIYPEMTTEQKKHYKAIKKEFATEVKGKTLEIDSVMEQITKMRQVLGGFLYTDDGTVRLNGCKEKVIKKLITRHQDSQIVFWCAYKEEITMIHQLLQRMGRTPTVYHGEMSDHSKDAAKKYFNEGQFTDIVCQGGCGVGLNEFVVANTMIYYSNTDRRRHRSQSEKRVIRPTQKADMVFVYDIVVPDSWDEIIYNRLQDKKKTSQKLLSWKDWTK